MVYRIVDRARRPLAWTLLVGGLAGVVATAFGWRAQVWLIATIGWLLVALYGFDQLHADLEQELEPTLEPVAMDDDRR